MGLDTHLAGKAAYGLHIVGNHLWCYSQNTVKIALYSLEVRDKGLKGCLGVHTANGLDSLCPDDTSHILEVVAVYGGNHRMGDIHQLDRAGYLFRLFPVYRIRTPCFYPTEAAGARTDISQNHKSSGTMSPAFAHIGATPRGTNGIELIFVHQATKLGIFLSCRELHPKPLWLSSFLYRSSSCSVHKNSC